MLLELQYARPYHLRRRMNDGHLVENRGAIVGDRNVTVARLDHLVHATRTERRAYCIGNSLKYMVG